VALEYERWTPFWVAVPALFGEKLGSKVTASLKRAFDDQVDRWGAAEGMNLRRSIEAPDWSLVASSEGGGLPNFVDLLFEWGGRLRLGERMVADGSVLPAGGAVSPSDLRRHRARSPNVRNVVR
jgi:hypothetical protein